MSRESKPRLQTTIHIFNPIKAINIYSQFLLAQYHQNKILEEEFIKTLNNKTLTIFARTY
jgi:hypothetical protein